MCWYSFREKTLFVFIQSLSWDPGEQTEHSSSHTGGNLQLMQIFITQLTSAERCWFIGDEVFCTVVVFSLFIQNPAVLNIGQSSEIRFPDVYSCPQWSSSGFTLARPGSVSTSRYAKYQEAFLWFLFSYCFEPLGGTKASWKLGWPDGLPEEGCPGETQN